MGLELLLIGGALLVGGVIVVALFKGAEKSQPVVQRQHADLEAEREKDLRPQ